MSEQRVSDGVAQHYIDSTLTEFDRVGVRREDVEDTMLDLCDDLLAARRELKGKNAEIKRLKNDQADWRKGVALIASGLGEHNPKDLSAVRLCELALTLRAAREQAERERDEARIENAQLCEKLAAAQRGEDIPGLARRIAELQEESARYHDAVITLATRYCHEHGDAIERGEHELDQCDLCRAEQAERELAAAQKVIEAAKTVIKWLDDGLINHSILCNFPRNKVHCNCGLSQLRASLLALDGRKEGR